MFALKQFGNIMGLIHTAIIIPVLIGPTDHGGSDFRFDRRLQPDVRDHIRASDRLDPEFLDGDGSNPKPSVLSGALDPGATGAIGYLH